VNGEAVNVGVAAHITGAASGGPRRDWAELQALEQVGRAAPKRDLGPRFSTTQLLDTGMGPEAHRAEMSGVIAHTFRWSLFHRRPSNSVRVGDIHMVSEGDCPWEG
jgi:hypothetical protein